MCKKVIPGLENNRGLKKNKLILRKLKTAQISSRIEVSYEPINGQSCLPKFNSDKKCPYPTFYLPCDAKAAVRQAKSFINFYLKRTNKQVEKNQLYMYGPQVYGLNFCSVCSIQYLKYFEHIKTEEHLKHCQNSTFYKLILQMSLKVQKRNDKERQAMMDMKVTEGDEQKSTNDVIEIDKQ